MKKQRDPNAQAEVICISLAQNILKTTSLQNCALYTTYEPSRDMLNLIKDSHVQRVYYGAHDIENGAFHGRSHIDKKELEEEYGHIEFVDGLLMNDSMNLLESFFRARRREAPNQILLSSRGWSSS